MYFLAGEYPNKPLENLALSQFFCIFVGVKLTESFTLKKILLWNRESPYRKLWVASLLHSIRLSRFKKPNVSYSDLLRISFADMTDGEEEVTSVVYDMYTIPQIMAKTPLTVEADTSIKEVAEILAKQSFHSIPVLDKGKLVGLVTTTDLIKYLLEQY